MRKFLWCTAAIILHIYSFGQADSTKFILKDSLPPPDTLIEKKSIPIVNGKQQVYKLKPAVDIPVVAVAAGWSAYAFTKIYSKDTSSIQKILSLDVNDINGFDRWAVRPYSESVGNTSNYLFYGAMPLPLLFLIDKATRKDLSKFHFYIWKLCR